MHELLSRNFEVMLHLSKMIWAQWLDCPVTEEVFLAFRPPEYYMTITTEFWLKATRMSLFPW